MMRKYKTEFKKLQKQSQSDLPRMTDQELLGDLYDVYYNSRDLKLLLDLLATSSGVAPCLRLLCLFDRNMRKMAEVSNLSVCKHYDEGKKRTDAIVKFTDPIAMKDIFSKIQNVTCTYTVEIIPPLCTGSVHLLKHDTTPYWSPIRSFNGLGDTELVNVNMDSLCVRKTKFKNIETEVEYTFRVSTLIDGKT